MCPAPAVRCDRPPCCRAECLEGGTQADSIGHRDDPARRSRRVRQRLAARGQVELPLSGAGWRPTNQPPPAGMRRDGRSGQSVSSAVASVFKPAGELFELDLDRALGELAEVEALAAVIGRLESTSRGPAPACQVETSSRASESASIGSSSGACERVVEAVA